MLSAGTVWSFSSRLFRSLARSTSVPSGRRNTKSPKAKCSVMNRPRSASSVSEYLRRKAAPTSRAPDAKRSRLDWSRIGRSGAASRTRRASANPASGVATPPRGNSTSEISPSRWSR